MRGRVTGFFIVLAIAASGGAASAQAAATVSLGDPAYAAIDELAAALPVQGLFVGQRPYSRREVARIALRFDSVLSRGPTPPNETQSRLLSIVRSLLNAYANEVRSLATRAPGSPLSA